MMPDDRVFPTHGRLACSLCFSAPGATISSGNWRFRNDPGHWGSSTPKILVLGFSKGAKQADAGSFEDVAFAGNRRNLQRVLATLGLVTESEDFNDRFRSVESCFAFASLLRCSAAMLDERTGKFMTSGPIILRSFRDANPKRMLENCANQFLRYLPSQLRLVLMLGAATSYIARCQKLIGSIHADSFSSINPVAYSAGKVTWVHVPHPSGSNNGYIKDWVSASATSSMGAKRELAKKAIGGIQEFIG
jgi:hypothetical protein